MSVWIVRSLWVLPKLKQRTKLSFPQHLDCISIPVFPSHHRALPSHERAPGCVRWASLSWRHASVTLSLITPQDVHSAPQMSHSSYLSPTHRGACFAYGNKGEKKKHLCMYAFFLLFLSLMITQSRVITLMFKLERALDAFGYC